MNNVDKLFKRYFTKKLENNKDLTVYDLFKWKKVDAFLKDHKTGNVIIDMKDLEFPENYSQNACDIIASKYFRKAGVPNEFGYENSMRMVAHRMISFFCASLKEEGLIKTDEQSKIFYDEMVYAFLNQMYAPNSPQWFNTGLKLSYGIAGNKQGTYYYNEKDKKIVETADNYTRTQASACFILSVEDKLLGEHSITDLFVTETKLFKGGSGTGSNFSALRAKGEQLSGGGFSSGLMSFLKALDRNAGAIKSGGTTRRAAKMLCLNIDHPEIMEYITWKAREEDKVRALAKMGYDADFEGEAYETVSGQNGNNSVRFSDEFMNKVENLTKNPNETIELKGRVDKRVNRNVKVSDLWDAFSTSSWKCADPSPQFDDTFNAWHTCPAGEDGEYNTAKNRINSTNPCGEYAFLDDSSCNLASINIYKFYDTQTKKFNVEAYLHVIGIVQLMLEASINWGQFPTEEIARKTYLFRASGLGLSNLASLFMVMGVPYDSEEARSIAASLAGILTGYSYYVSSLMAAEVGPFDKYQINSKYMKKVLRNHARAAGSFGKYKEEAVKKNPEFASKNIFSDKFEGLSYVPSIVSHETLNNNGLNYLCDALDESWILALNSGEQFGYRNAQVTVMAPTGTISFAMDCGATSIEPFFSHIVYKKLSGGGFMTIVNPVLKDALKNLNYTPDEIAEICDYIKTKETADDDGLTYEKVLDGKIEGAPYLKDEHLAIFDTANKCGTGERFIDAMGHVNMVAAITPLISGAISKTVNLPKDATVEDFKDIVITSWKLGVKGITMYRDSSKATQPLNTSLSDDVEFKLEDLTYAELLKKAKELEKGVTYSKRNKPMGIRNGTTHPAQIDDVKIYTTINRRENGEISEIYISTDREGTIITGLLNSLSKAISVMLQYHVPAYNISRMLRGQKYEPYGFVQKHPYIKYVSSISDLISKIIDIELGDYSRCQVKPEDYKNTVNNDFAIPLDQTAISSDDVSKEKKYDGERLYGVTCPNCSSTKMIRNGTCMVCLECGSTTGCS